GRTPGRASGASDGAARVRRGAADSGAACTRCRGRRAPNVRARTTGSRGAAAGSASSSYPDDRRTAVGRSDLVRPGDGKHPRDGIEVGALQDVIVRVAVPIDLIDEAPRVGGDVPAELVVR